MHTVKTISTIIGGLFIIQLACYGNASAQVNIRHVQPQFIERGEESIFLFEAPEVNELDVLEALFFYRVDGSGSFRQQEVEFRNGSATIPLIVENANSSSVEYYFMLRMVSGRQYTFPNITQDQSPLTVEVLAPRVPEYPETDQVDVAILSPMDGSAILQDDLFLSAALFYDEDDLRDAQIKLHINGEDVSEQAEISPYIIKYNPVEFERGSYTAQILMEENGTVFEVTRWTFSVAGDVVLGNDLLAADQQREFGGNVELGGRSQAISGTLTDALQGRLEVRGREKDLRYSLRSYVTTQESNRYQPQNRYTANLQFRETAFLTAGDASPQFSNFSIRGRRVRGIHGGFSIADDKFQFETIYGSLSRSIKNMYQPIDVRISESENAFEEQFLLELENGGAGAYKRKIAGGRFSIGRPEKFQFALNAIRVRDDTTSLERVRDFNDLLSHNPGLTESLNEQQNQFLVQNPEQLQVSAISPRPQENLAISTEFKFSADEERIHFHSEFGASLLNQDISKGVFDQEQAERLGIDLGQNLENLFSNLSWLIIINDQMSTLPFRYREEEIGNTGVNLFFPSSILANETRTDFNYFNHRVQLQYRWIGPDYHSLANSTIRRDVAGFSLTDRFSLVQNRIFMVLGAERLHDNVNNYKDASTVSSGLRGSVSWYPFKRKLPRVNAGLRYRVRDNSITPYNPFVDSEFVNAAVRNYKVADGDTLITSTPRSDQLMSYNFSVSQSFTLWDANHQAGISFQKNRTKSRVFEYGNSESQNISFSLLSQFAGKPFRTRLSYNLTSSLALSGLNAVDIHSADIGLDWALLNKKLLLNGLLSFARSGFENINLEIDNGPLEESSRDNIFLPDFENSDNRITNSYILRMGAEYSILMNSTLSMLINYSLVDNRVGRFGNIPNDRIIQINYTYRF